MLAMNILPVHILAENKANGASLILDKEKISLEGNGSYDHNKKVDQGGTGEVLATVGSVALMTGPLVAAPVGMLNACHRVSVCTVSSRSLGSVCPTGQCEDSESLDPCAL